MAEPQVISEQEYWLDPEKKDKAGNPIVYSTEPPEAKGRSNWNVGGMDLGVGGVKSYTHVNRVTFENGEIFDYKDDGSSTYVKTDPQKATTWRASQKAPSETAQWSLRQGKDGKTYRVNELTGEAIPVEGIPGTQEKDDYALAFDQHLKFIDDIAKRRAMATGTPGALTEAEANRYIELSKQNMEATLLRTTPWQMKQAEEAKGRAAASQARQEQADLERQAQQGFSNLMTRGNLGRGVTNDRAGMGQNMAELLLNAALKSWTQTASGAPGAKESAQFNPLAAASRYTSEYYPQDLSDAARTVLMNALQGIGTVQPGGASPAQGPVMAPSSMPEPPMSPLQQAPPTAQAAPIPRPMGGIETFEDPPQLPPEEVERLARALMAGANRGGW